MRRMTQIGVAGLLTVAGLAFAEPPKNQPATKDNVKPVQAQPGNAKPDHGKLGEHGQPGDMQLPPGWTPEDMQKCVEAGTPGEMHQFLSDGAGTWTGKQKMWMAPGTEPMTVECTMTMTPIMDGRYIKSELKGDMPGMGPYTGFGINGYDNVAKHFQGTWIDNHSTGIMTGKGELSSDNKTLTWNFEYNCPVTQKPTKLREIDKITGKDTRTMEMYGTDPKSGKEFKMMEIAFTRTGAAPAPSAKH